ncbi:hypothetical protein DV453_003153 [Geotrichum candidum]|nr:hypothetical protein DV453_003153 [Geotrichum candidum]
MWSVITALFRVLLEVAYYWYKQLEHYLITPAFDPTAPLKQQLLKATDYEEWCAIAHQIDSALGNDLWRQTPGSSKYDYKLISTRLKQLAAARDEENASELVSLLRSGLLRNLGSIANSELYNRSYFGTKLLIEEYISEVIGSLEYLADTRTYFASHQAKLDFLHDTRQSFGRSGLVLHGGSMFGMCHVGVVKGLFLQGLLPRIVSGATVGALVAALVCFVNDDELLPVLNDLPHALACVHHGFSEPSDSTGRRKATTMVERILSAEYPPELLSLAEHVRLLLGDTTFEQAYLKSDRVLNITITPVTAKPHSIPTLLNYLTTPNMTVWSAVKASLGTGTLPHSTTDMNDIVLMCKDYRGQLKPYTTELVTFLPANKAIYGDDRASPYTKQAELFNVNNFTVSLARPYLAPLFAGEQTYRGRGGWLPRLSKVFKLELQHRLWQLAKMGMLPDLVHRVLVDERVQGGEDVTIVPELESLVKDILLDEDEEEEDANDEEDGPDEASENDEDYHDEDVFQNEKEMDTDYYDEYNSGTETPPQHAALKLTHREDDGHHALRKRSKKVEYYIKTGEHSIWPFVSIIWARCAVEFVLDDLYSKALRQKY